MSDIYTWQMASAHASIYQSMLTCHGPTVVNVLRTVGHCGGSEIKKGIVFLHRPTVSCLKTSMHRHEPQGFIWFCLCMFFFLSKPWVPLTDIVQGSQVIVKVWSEIRGGATQRGGASQRGGATQIFTAPKFLLAVQFYLLFIIGQHK